MKLTLLSVIILALFFLMTGNMWGPLETSEARYAEISREMFVSGDLMHPTLLNIYHYHKPPLTYWITALAYYLFGVTPFAVRFFLVVVFIIQFFLMTEIAKTLLDDWENGFLAGWIYASMPLVMVSVRGLTTDAYMMTFVLLGIFCWIRFLWHHKIIFVYGAAISFGLAFLAKGPVALILPLLAIISLLNWKPLPLVPLIHWIFSILIFLAVSLSWFVILIAENKSFIDYFIFHHTLNRITHAEVFSRAKPFYYYFLILPALALPWIVPFVMKSFRPANWSDPLIRRVMIFWVIVPLVFFSSVSSKLPLYILPVFPGLSILTAYFLKESSYRRLPLIFLFINLVISLTLIFGPRYFLDSNADVNLLLPGIAMLLISLLSYSLIPETGLLKVSTLVLLTGLLTSMILVLSSDFSSDFNTATLGRIINEKKSPNNTVLVFDELLPSLAFHLNEVPVSVFNGNKALKREVLFQNDSSWKNYLIDFTNSAGKEKVVKYLTDSSLLIVRREKVHHLTPYLTGLHHDIDTVGNRLIFQVYKNE